MTVLLLSCSKNGDDVREIPRLGQDQKELEPPKNPLLPYGEVLLKLIYPKNIFRDDDFSVSTGPLPRLSFTIPKGAKFMATPSLPEFATIDENSGQLFFAKNKLTKKYNHLPFEITIVDSQKRILSRPFTFTFIVQKEPGDNLSEIPKVFFLKKGENLILENSPLLDQISLEDPEGNFSLKTSDHFISLTPSEKFFDLDEFPVPKVLRAKGRSTENALPSRIMLWPSPSVFPSCESFSSVEVKDQILYFHRVEKSWGGGAISPLFSAYAQSQGLNLFPKEKKISLSFWNCQEAVIVVGDEKREVEIISRIEGKKGESVFVFRSGKGEQLSVLKIHSFPEGNSVTSISLHFPLELSEKCQDKSVKESHTLSLIYKNTKSQEDSQEKFRHYQQLRESPELNFCNFLE